MKILQLLHDYLPEHVGGVEVHAHALARALRERGHRVLAVFTERDLARREGTWREGRLDGVRTLELVHQREYAGLSETWLQPRARRAFEALLERERPDVVHAHQLGPWGPGVLASARALGCRVLFTAHDLHPICDEGRRMRRDGTLCEGPPECVDCLARHPPPRASGPGGQAPDLTLAAELRALAFREGLGAAHRVIAPSAWMAGELAAFGLDPERIEVLAPGVSGPTLEAPRSDSARCGAPPGRSGGLRIGFLGGLYPAKGAHVLIEAFARLAAERSAVTLELHGVLEWFPDYVDALRRRAARLPADSVVFAGRFEPARVDAVLARLDVVVVPSVWPENAPLVVQDARRRRVPLVVAGHGGLAEAVRDGVDGLHFRPGDADDLARVLRRLVEEPALAGNLAAAGELPLSSERVAEVLEGHYAFERIRVPSETGPSAVDSEPR